MAVSFIGGNRSARRNLLTCCKSLAKLECTFL